MPRLRGRDGGTYRRLAAIAGHASEGRLSKQRTRGIRQGESLCTSPICCARLPASERGRGASARIDTGAYAGSGKWDGGRMESPRARRERQLACGTIATFNEGRHPAQGPVHPLRYFAPVLSLVLSCLMRHVSAWPSMNSPSAMAAAAGATCSVPSSVTFW